jgi:hypothetical protein
LASFLISWYGVIPEKKRPGQSVLKGGHANLFVSPRVANPQILGLIQQYQISKFLRCVSIRKSQIRKFVMINPHIANLQIFLGFPVSKSAICKEKAVFLIQIRICLPLILVFTYVYFRLRNAMSQTVPKVVLKFE